ncbi:DUF2252 domain-containing protein [Micropruina sp.]|uniref:DUF2252 domain-containing protein n=1 Tax=Micropruina sp. TaxID=2737536 RepID=UPI0039E626FF
MTDQSDTVAERPPHPTRKADGKALRRHCPLESHAELPLASDRDPIGLLIGQAATRVPELVPIRYRRMLVSPFTFYRGAALVMAADLSRTPTTGLRAQLCGDAHLSNFGAYASAERRLVFDLNDFDETLPGPFEWDVKRLAASLVIAARNNGFTAKQARKSTIAAVRRYRQAMHDFAGQPFLDVWYSGLDLDNTWSDFVRSLSPKRRERHGDQVRAAEASLAKARSRTGLQAIRKLTTERDGRRRIVADPPLVVPLEELSSLEPDAMRHQLDLLVASYRHTLASDRRVLLDHFRLTDVAHKVVGVGSVGTRAWILLFEGAGRSDALLLQAKQAQASVLEPYAGASTAHSEGERVVTGQRLMQAASDIFLGWLKGVPEIDGGVDYYLRQLRDWKFSADIEQMRPSSLTLYAAMCGWTLARAHARSGDRVAIAGYLGKSEAFENAVADFAEHYADVNERDHAALAEAVASGRVKAAAEG